MPGFAENLRSQMIFKTKIFFAAACAFIAVSVPAFSQQDSRIAGLSEDIAALRSEVARLRLELEELRAENARLLQLAEKRVNPGDEVAAKVASLRAEFKETLSVQRREITNETDAKIKALADMTNRAMADLSKSVNRAATASEAAPENLVKPKDFPAGGIEYTVKPGDTLGKIIERQGSKKAWILYANPTLNPDKIFVGQKIFVPQKD